MNLATKSCATGSFPEPIDAVYTWVDGSDPAFQESCRQCLRGCPATDRRTAAGHNRFRDNEELRFSLRSLDAYAPWVRRIFIVTNGQVPPWLDAENPRICIVTHDSLFSDEAALPTFNSHAIELQLHKIPGLSQRFLYLNDDFFFGRRALPSDFITPAGGTYAYFEKTAVPQASPKLSVHDRACVHTQAAVGRLTGGHRLVYLSAHVPQLYDKTILGRLQQLLADECRETSGHRFRAGNDLTMRIAYFSYLLFSGEQKGKGHEARFLEYGKGRYHFIMLAGRLQALWRGLCSTLLLRPKFFCVNDDLIDEPFDSRMIKSFSFFLKLYFPQRSSYEKKLGATALDAAL